LLARVREVVVLLRIQARELRNYWDTDEKAAADRFQKARRDTWAGIKDVFGLED
jgi:hypothetical protein